MILAVIGTGNMGEAMVRAFIGKKVLKSDQIRLFDKDSQKLQKLSDEMGCKMVSSPKDAVIDADLVLLAVKPQQMDELLEKLSIDIGEHAVVMSIAAAYRLSRLKKHFKKGQPLVRMMPNTPVLVGAGYSAICFDNVDEKNQLFIKSLMDATGQSVICDEPMLDALGCVSGTGPAYTMLYIEALADAAVRIGIPRVTALEAAQMTVFGAAKLAIESKEHPAVLKDKVCSPGGTTIEGIAALEALGFRAAVHEAVFAADAKTKELAGGA